jgi:hypothetical protein
MFVLRLPSLVLGHNLLGLVSPIPAVPEVEKRIEEKGKKYSRLSFASNK